MGEGGPPRSGWLPRALSAAPASSHQVAGGEEAQRRVLVAEDDADIRRLIALELRRAGYAVVETANGEEALARVAEALPDVIVSDLMMPRMDGLTLLRRLRADGRTRAVPVIVLTAKGITADLVAGFELGADDYLVKPFRLAELRARVAAKLARPPAPVELLGDLAALRQDNAALWSLALADPLTGLANRRALDLVWPREVARAERHGAPCCVLAADLDHFKQINDRTGHAMGDRVLGAVAGVLTATVRAEDFVARVGGEEFTILLPQTDLPAAVAVAERLRVAVAAIDLSPGPAGCTLSIGLACSRLTPLPALLLAADRALYQAKAHGRDRVEVWPGAYP